MDLEQSAMTIGTWGLAVANFRQLITLLGKNPEPIKGVSLGWAVACTVSLIFIALSFAITGWWISFLAQIPPIATYSLMSYRLWRQEQ